MLSLGLGGAVAAAIGGVGGIELVSNGTLPGKTVLDRLDGGCSGTFLGLLDRRGCSDVARLCAAWRRRMQFT